MIWVARIGVALAGLFSLAMGGMAWASPAQLGATLGLGALTPLGLNALRADLGAFFLASAIACALALFARRPNWLWGAALLYGLAVTARFIGIAVDGPPEGVAAPVIVELVLVALLVFGARKLPQAG
ncbi:MAG: DUF4345 family protein [Parvibaculum sp.]|uniref:DUF4345 family protein n=1 Tax=Parvibaculum sp. TaxID=2024848 RepID=UPI00284FD52D|nr:DUF4345 family protein [Parvibaculum sp.]MDR3499611.1 DUF4345 family protein [Parvibaculum sp.]